MKELEGWEVLKLVTEQEVKVGTIFIANDKHGIIDDENGGIWLIVEYNDLFKNELSLKIYNNNRKEILTSCGADFLLNKKFRIKE